MAKADLDRLASVDEMKTLLLQIVEALVDDPHSMEMASDGMKGSTCFRPVGSDRAAPGNGL